MKYWVARAMQVADLTMDELTALQTREKSIGRCLMAWEIQWLLKKRPLLEVYSIPGADASAQEKHRQRIEQEIRTRGWLRPVGEFSETDVASCHTFDSEVISNAGALIWDYSGKKTEVDTVAAVRRHSTDFRELDHANRAVSA
jgi:hypothetical protein